MATPCNDLPDGGQLSACPAREMHPDKVVSGPTVLPRQTASQSSISAAVMALAPEILLKQRKKNEKKKKNQKRRVIKALKCNYPRRFTTLVHYFYQASICSQNIIGAAGREAEREQGEAGGGRRGRKLRGWLLLKGGVAGWWGAGWGGGVSQDNHVPYITLRQYVRH